MYKVLIINVKMYENNFLLLSYKLSSEIPVIFATGNTVKNTSFRGSRASSNKDLVMKLQLYLSSEWFRRAFPLSSKLPLNRLFTAFVLYTASIFIFYFYLCAKIKFR